MLDIKSVATTRALSLIQSNCQDLLLDAICELDLFALLDNNQTATISDDEIHKVPQQLQEHFETLKTYAKDYGTPFPAILNITRFIAPVRVSYDPTTSIWTFEPLTSKILPLETADHLNLTNDEKFIPYTTDGTQPLINWFAFASKTPSIEKSTFFRLALHQIGKLDKTAVNDDFDILLNNDEFIENCMAHNCLTPITRLKTGHACQLAG